MEWREAKEWLKDSNIPCTNCDELDCGGLCSIKEAVDTLVEIVEKVEELRDELLTSKELSGRSGLITAFICMKFAEELEKILKGSGE